MKILHVSLLTPQADAHSGAGVVIHEQFQALRRRHDMTLVLLAPTNAAEVQAQNQLREPGLDIHVLRGNIPYPVVRIKRLIQDTIGRARGWPAMGLPNAMDPALPKLVDRLISQGSFDLLQVENLGLSRIPATLRLPTLIIEHEVREQSLKSADGVEDIQAAMWEQADLVQVFTARDAADIKRRAPAVAERVRINPFGVEAPSQDGFQSPAIRQRDTVTFIGNFRHTPNIDAAQWLCQDIFPLIQSRKPNAQLMIVGQHPPPSLRRKASDSITVTGRVPQTQPFLDLTTVTVVPARKGGGMRVKTLQALASGCPVVSTRLGAEGLLGPSSDWPVILADEAGEFADAVVQLLDSPEAAENLGVSALNFIHQNHTWSAYCDRLESNYREITSAHDGGAA